MIDKSILNINKNDIDYDIPNVSCVQCKFHHCGCKRLLNNNIEFYRNCFTSKGNDTGSLHGICLDYQVADWANGTRKELSKYETLEDFLKHWIQVWLPYKDIDCKVSFFVNGDEHTAYQVSYLDFVNGTLYNGNKLMAHKKYYYKRYKNENGMGYKVVYDDIDGVEININESKDNQ